MKEYHGRLSNSELSRILNYNGSYLGRIVKKYTGKSLYDYSMDFTMDYAMKKLAEDTIPISALVEELHFSNRTHFYQIFKEHTGLTPKEYRKQFQH